MQKKILGLIESITIEGEAKVKAHALCDTGAKSTSVDIKLAQKAKLGPRIKTIQVKNPSTKQVSTRPVVKAKIDIGGAQIDTEINLLDRSHMKFPVIIGRNILSGKFIIDPEKNQNLWKDRKSEVEIKQKRLGEFK